KDISTYTENIGIGGICVNIEEDLGLFQGVNLELDLKNGTPENISASGTVVWVIKKRDHKQEGGMVYDTGIEFLDLSPSAKARIAKIVEEQLKKNPVK
ncbi:MAG: PilZ domain-containing protein, partial [Candidatus Omnitrophota bacterium]